MKEMNVKVTKELVEFMTKKRKRFDFYINRNQLNFESHDRNVSESFKTENDIIFFNDYQNILPQLFKSKVIKENESFTLFVIKDLNDTVKEKGLIMHKLYINIFDKKGNCKIRGLILASNTIDKNSSAPCYELH